MPIKARSTKKKTLQLITSHIAHNIPIYSNRSQHRMTTNNSIILTQVFFTDLEMTVDMNKIK